MPSFTLAPFGWERSNIMILDLSHPKGASVNQAPFINAVLFGDGTETTSMHKGVVARIKRAY